MIVWLLAAACVCVSHAAETRGTTSTRLIDSFLAADAQALDAPPTGTARSEFDVLVRQATPCSAAAMAKTDRARCVIDAVFTSPDLATIAELSDPESSTVTSALTSQRGNCAALTALVLAVAEQVEVPMAAIVFPRHSVVQVPGDDGHVFELLYRGTSSTLDQLSRRLGADGRHETRVKARDFPAYYTDNLAVRLADAGDPARAEAMFEQAIEAGPRVGRIRFNYGTFLLGVDRLDVASDQLRRAVRLDARNAPAWANLGVALAKLGKSDDARRCFQRALRVDPANRIAAENLKALGSTGSPPP